MGPIRLLRVTHSILFISSGVPAFPPPTGPDTTEENVLAVSSAGIIHFPDNGDVPSWANSKIGDDDVQVDDSAGRGSASAALL